MRTSLNEIRETENYLNKKSNSLDSLVFEARLLTNPQLRMNLFLQKKVYFIIKMFHRKQIKQEFEQISDRLFTDPAKEEFQQKILHLFNK